MSEHGFQEYKDSGIEWLGEIPAHWQVRRLRTVLCLRNEKNSPIKTEQILSLSIKRGVTLYSHEGRGGNKRKGDITAYKIAHAGDIVLNSMNVIVGAVGLSRYTGAISPVYYALFPATDEVDIKYYDKVFGNVAFQRYLLIYGKGILIKESNTGKLNTIRMKISPDDLKGTLLPIPPKDEQHAIATFLDRETARIDLLVEKKQKLLLTASERIEALVDHAISNASVPRIRFENVVRRINRPVVLSEHEELVRLGLYNRGRGLFKKPAADEEGMGDSDFIFIKAGDLILSGQFSWEGAVALSTANEEGCVVSHRYPVYRGLEGVKEGYLLGLLRSGFGDFLLNQASRGAAGRNRPLNTWRLGKEKIPIPDATLQIAISDAVEFERLLKKKIEKLIDRLREFRSALITAAVTGQIDVTTWGKRGDTDRRLDTIEGEMTS